MFLEMKEEDERGWMKPPPTFVNKSNLVILLVYLFVVGMSSHPVNIWDLLLGDPLSDGSVNGGGYRQPSPLSGVIVACGGIDFGWGGETTHHFLPTSAHSHSKHVNQTCLHTRLN